MGVVLANLSKDSSDEASGDQVDPPPLEQSQIAK